MKKTKKVKGVVLKKLLREKKRVCLFCGSEKKLEKHHIIPVQIGGKNLPNNKIDICSNCHLKLHKLLNPVIQHLLSKERM